MAQEKLPSELEEDILIRLPPLSLAHFRIVCKRWNTLFNDKRFIHNHLARACPQFIFATNSKFFSVTVHLDDDDDPKIEERELTLGIPGLESRQQPRNIHHCDGLLLCCWYEGSTIWNPWLGQSRWIESYSKEDNMHIYGIGYNDGYKILAFQESEWIFYNFASNCWKDYDIEFGCVQGSNRGINSVSLNGTLYLLAFSEDLNKCLILSLDCSREILEIFCYLPSKKKYLAIYPILAVFKGDRFSLLEQCNETEKIEIWVTKNKIVDGDGEDVVWIIFMTVSISNNPGLVHTGFLVRTRYYIDDKTLIMCFCDDVGQAWIHVFRGNKWSKLQIDSVVDRWPLYRIYFPSLVPISRGQREDN